jgi:hypothetical protein
MRPDPCITYWTGDRFALGDSLELLRLGGHFAGGRCSTRRGWAAGRS